MAEDLPALLDRLGAKALELRELIAEANAVTKDLRQAIREGRQFCEQEINAGVGRYLDAAVSKGLEDYVTTVSQAQRAAEKRVAESLDELVNATLGKPGSRRDLRPGLIGAAKIKRHLEESHRLIEDA